MAACENSLLCVNKAWEAEWHRLSELSVSIQAVEQNKKKSMGNQQNFVLLRQ